MESAAVLEASAPPMLDVEALDKGEKPALVASSSLSSSTSSTSSLSSSLPPSAPSLAASLATPALPENSGEQPTTYVDVGLAAPRAPEPEGLAVGGLPMRMLPGAVGPSGGPDFGGGDGLGGRPRADTVMSEEDENELDAAVCGDDYADGDLQLMAQVVLGTLPDPFPLFLSFSSRVRPHNNGSATHNGQIFSLIDKLILN